MRTYPEFRTDGSVHRFEITSAWVSFRPIYKILRSIDGVTDIKRNWFQHERITFNYHGEPVAIWEPYGDNSRYTVVATRQGNRVKLDDVHVAFKRHQNLLQKAWSVLIRRRLNA